MAMSRKFPTGSTRMGKGGLANALTTQRAAGVAKSGNVTAAPAGRAPSPAPTSTRRTRGGIKMQKGGHGGTGLSTTSRGRRKL